MSYYYLLINLALLLLSFLLALDKKASPIRSWKPMIPAVLASGLFFSVVALVFNQFKLSVFSAEYTVGVHILQLPIEEILFHFILAFAGLNVYVVLNAHFSKNNLEKFSLSFSNLLLGVLFAMLFFTYTKLYSVVTFSVLFLLLFYIEYVNKLRFMYKFYRAYVVLLIPFCLLYLLIGGLPILTYVFEETIKLKLGTIPFENLFSLMSNLLLSVYLFEVIKSKT
ncbi:lycopene cyclase domain-containing protein [Pedobacter sp. V48]|uniref:lycopene cyclase domain-containing protein n=1 Tax=Pedobacter sp. V48 TaxID=509635 RepID=UPI0003E55C32|nr:lycopene cyclase domain-containing protein [Pedobacter sp. V48]ETZ21274.1 hypothetical protein N824_29440 [Pedobacter sp. V48]